MASQGNAPFVIAAHKAVITVLGTRFNVRAWESGDRVEVAVAEGRVAMRSRKVRTAEDVVIHPGQMSVVKADEAPSQPTDVDIDAQLAWLRQEKYFQNTPLQEVLDQLQRWYELEFHLTDTSYFNNRITVFIEKKPVDEILDMLALVNDLSVQRRGRYVVFSPRD